MTDTDDTVYTLPAEVIAASKAAAPHRAVRTSSWTKICRCGHAEGFHTPATGADTPATSTIAKYARFSGDGCFGALARYAVEGVAERHCSCEHFDPVLETKGGGRVFRQHPRHYSEPPLTRGLIAAAERNADPTRSHQIGIRWLVPQVCHRCGSKDTVLPYYSDSEDHRVELGCVTCVRAAPLYAPS
jgi:hypothetical protein